MINDPLNSSIWVWKLQMLFKPEAGAAQGFCGLSSIRSALAELMPSPVTGVIRILSTWHVDQGLD